MAKDLVFLPLGGCGEIGMNASLYGYGEGIDRKWILIDLGVSFSDTAPGAEAAMADLQFIDEIEDGLLGLVITHGHEDHIGAIPHLIERLNVPVFATRFTMALIRRKLQEAGNLEKADLRITDTATPVLLPPFEIRYVAMTHSIPEAHTLAIRTPAGQVVHSGDFKFDPTPTLGPESDETTLKSIGDEGVTALMCDSTNAQDPGISGSELAVREELIKTIARRGGRVAVTTFASNVARLDAVLAAAVETQRSVCVVGRSMRRIIEVAQETSTLTNMPNVISEDESAALPPDKVLYLITGSQGEPRAALWRIATGQHPRVRFMDGDTVFFSSKIIPGNEIAIYGLQNALVARGVEVVTEKDEPIHVSGHPNHDELARMYKLIRPQALVPIHGERMHLHAHADFARSQGIPNVVVAENGDMVRIAPEPYEVVDQVHTGRVYLDGGSIIASSDRAFVERETLGQAGLIQVTLVLDDDGDTIAGPDVRLAGVPAHLDEGKADLEALIVKAVERQLAGMPSAQRIIEEAVEGEVKHAVRRVLGPRWDKRPMIMANAICLEE